MVVALCGKGHNTLGVYGMSAHAEIHELRQTLADEARGGVLRRRRAARRLAQLATGADGQTFSRGPDAARAVVEGLVAGLEGVHWGASTICRRALAQLTEPHLIEAVCDVLLKRDFPRLQALAVHSRYAPRDPVRRAAYLFILGRLQFYEAHDPDGSLIEQYYLGAPPLLRERLVQLAQNRGDQGWPHWLRQLGQQRGWATLREVELRAALDVLCRAQQWSEVWAIVLGGRLLWSWRGARALLQKGWQPQGIRATACWQEVVAAVQAVPDPASVSALVARQVMELREPQGGVKALALSPDSRILISGSPDGTIRLWELPEGKVRTELRGHQGRVRALAVSTDGRILASGSEDKTVRLWRLPRGEIRAALHGHQGWVKALALSPDGRLLASSGDLAGPIRLWELPEGKVRMELHGNHRSVEALVVSADGQLLVSGCRSGLQLWGLPRGEARAEWYGFWGGVEALALSPNGQLLISGGRDGTIRLWRLPRVEAQAVLRGHKGWIGALALSADGQLLVSGGRDGTIRLWVLPRGEALAVLPGHKGWVEALTMSPGGELLASSSNDGTIRLWELWNMPQMLQLPLGHRGQTEYERTRQFAVEQSLSPAQRAVARYVTAILRYRREEGGDRRSARSRGKA
jgi:WD40 repeat protein